MNKLFSQPKFDTPNALFNSPEKKVHEAIRPTDSLDILEWYQECMQSLERIAPPNEEKNRTSLFLLERKNSKFAILMYTGMALLLKNVNKILKSSAIDRISALPQEINFFNHPYAHIRGNEDDTLTSIFNIKMLDDNESLLKGFQTTLERFKYVFLHETGHGYLWDDYGKRNTCEEFFKTSTAQIDLSDLIGVQDRISEHPSISQKITDNFATTQLSTTSIENFKEFNQMQAILFQEMFCDTFSLLINAQDEKFTTPLKDMIELLAYNRRREALGASWVFGAEGNGVPAGYQAHETSLALQRLGAILEERHIDVKSLDLNAIKDLCKEVTIYGIKNFMYEASLVNSNYQIFLDCIEVKKSPQMNLFDGEVPKKNTDLLFSDLTPVDKQLSHERVEKIFKNIKRYSENGEQNHHINDDIEDIEKFEHCKKILTDKKNVKNFSSNFLAFKAAHTYLAITDQLAPTPRLITAQIKEAASKKQINAMVMSIQSPQMSLIERIESNRSTPLENKTQALKNAALNAVNKIVLVPPVRLTPRL